MTTGFDEFRQEFFQDLLLGADSAGKFVEDVFFENFTAYLSEAGEIDSADRADYRGPRGSGIRVDGYGGDPLESQGTLSLIILDFDQSENPGRLIGSEMDAIFRRLQNFLRKSLDPAWRDSLEESSPGFGLADMIAARWASITRIRMILLTDRLLSERVDGREADSLGERTVTYSVWDIGRLYRLVSEGRGREEIEIDLEKEFGSSLPILSANLAADDYAAYLAVVPGEMLARIYDRWGARLLEQNVRVFLQARGNVNKGIRTTLEQNPEMFLAYNNGITGTAEEVRTSNCEGRLELTGLKNFQIVNGGQTTASIHAAFRSKIDLSQVSVQMKLSIVDPERTEEIVPKISEFANSQNRVNAADFFANHPFHVRMEEFSRRLYAPSVDGEFRQTKWFYERARGQYQDARSQLSDAQRKKFDLEHPRPQLFSKTDLAKFVNVWQGIPEKVSLGAQKNFAHFAGEVGKAWDKRKTGFNEAWFREAVGKALVFKRTEKLVWAQDWYSGGYRANIVAYAISKLANDVSEKKLAVDFERIWKAQALSESMERALILSAEAAHGVLTDPPQGISNVTEWAKKQACWERVRNVVIDWPKDFLEELISLHEEKEVKRDARKDQKALDGIFIQRAVVNAGPKYWSNLRQWGDIEGKLTPKDEGVLNVASHMPHRIPTEAQSKKAFEIAVRLREEGCPFELPE